MQIGEEEAPIEVPEPASPGKVPVTEPAPVPVREPEQVPA
jgi:hypothetical protein